MDAIARPPPLPRRPPPLPERPVRIFVLAGLWIGLAIVAAVAVGVGLTLARQVTTGWYTGERALVLLTTVMTFAVMLWGARRRAWRVGQGDVRLGLGWGGIRRPGLLLVLGVLIVLVPLMWIGGLNAAFHPAHQAEEVGRMIRPTPDQSSALQIGNWLAIAAMAPLAEEMFFRGWLWTALRRRWRFPATAIGTAIPWLILHMPDGALRPVYLLPTALLLSVARERCGGVAASLTLHIVNNTLAVILVALAKG